MKRRIWLALVAFAMLLTVLPMSAFGIQLDEDIPIQTDFVNEAVATQENSPKTGEFYTIEGLGSIESVIPFSQLPSTLNLAQNPSFSYGSSWTKKVYYNQLDAVSKAVYDQIANSELAQGPINKQITINLSGIGTVDYMTILAALGALVYDYPEYSWLVNTGPEMYWDDNSVDFGLNQESVKKATVDVDEIPTTVTNRYYYANTGTLADITATVNRVKCEIDATLPTNPSDYITIKAIHDWICSNVEYTNTDGDRFKNNRKLQVQVAHPMVKDRTP